MYWGELTVPSHKHLMQTGHPLFVCGPVYMVVAALAAACTEQGVGLYEFQDSFQLFQ